MPQTDRQYLHEVQTQMEQLITQFGEGEVCAQFASMVVEMLDSQIEERNYVRLSESSKDADYFLSSDEGLILSTIDQKSRQLEVVAAFADFCQLRLTCINS